MLRVSELFVRQTVVPDLSLYRDVDGQIDETNLWIGPVAMEYAVVPTNTLSRCAAVLTWDGNRSACMVFTASLIVPT